MLVERDKVVHLNRMPQLVEAKHLAGQAGLTLYTADDNEPLVGNGVDTNKAALVLVRQLQVLLVGRGIGGSKLVTLVIKDVTMDVVDNLFYSKTITEQPVGEEVVLPLELDLYTILSSQCHLGIIGMNIEPVLFVKEHFNVFNGCCSERDKGMLFGLLR